MHSLSIISIKRSKFLYCQFFFIAFAFIAFYTLQLKSSAEFLLLLSIWNCISYAYLFYIEVKYAPCFHPFIIFPLIVIQYIGLNGINLYSNLEADIPVYFGIYKVNSYVAQGALFLTLEHFLIFLGYFYYDRIKMKRSENYDREYLNVFNENLPYMKWSIISYLLVWCVRILSEFVPLTSVSSIFMLLKTQGQLISLTLLVIIMLHDKDNNIAKRFFWLIIGIEIIRVLGSGMKESILQNILPYIIYLTVGYKNKKILLNARFILKLILLFIFIIYGVFPYVSVFRDIANRKGVSWNEIKVEEAVSEYIDYMMNEGHYSAEYAISDKGLDYALSRAGSIVCNSWSINYAQRNGLHPKYFYYCASAIVPRILWPDKPPVVIGGMMYKLATGHKDWETSGIKSRTAVTIGFIGGCYFSFGILGALFCPFIVGVFVCWFWYFLRCRIYYNPLAIWAFYTIIKSIFKDFENCTDGGFVFFIWSIAYVLIIKYLVPFNNYKLKEQ